MSVLTCTYPDSGDVWGMLPKLKYVLQPIVLQVDQQEVYSKTIQRLESPIESGLPTPGALSDDTMKEITKKLISTKKPVLEKNATYTAYGETFKTDDFGRVSVISASLTPGTLGSGRDGLQRDIGKIVNTIGDVGFHVIGQQFGGARIYPNVVPGDRVLNGYPRNWNPLTWTPTTPLTSSDPTHNTGVIAGGAWGQMEKLWRAAKDRGYTINVTGITLLYASTTDIRPNRLIVKFVFNGTTFDFAFKNNDTNAQLKDSDIKDFLTAIGVTVTWTPRS